MPSRKRKLTEDEIKDLRQIMESAPQGRKPSVRYFAQRYGVNQPSIIKSLGGWDGIQRGRPDPPLRPEIIKTGEPVVKLEEYTSKIELSK
jgi:hypothetical protein